MGIYVDKFTTPDQVQAEYQRKLVSADEAAKVVKSGDQIHLGLFTGCVNDLNAALARRVNELEDVTAVATMWGYPEVPPILAADPNAEHIHYCSTQLTGTERKQNKAGNCWYLPVQFRENPKFHEECRPVYNVAMLQVAPMDKRGFFNMGLQVAEYWGILRNCDKIIVEVNENMPITHGMENELNIAQVDYIVEGTNRPLSTIIAKEANEVEKQMALHILPLIPDGATLQLGVGGFPNMIGQLLAESDKGNFGCHTEMFVDAYMHLFKAGKLTNMKKTMFKGKNCFTFAQGSEELYEWIDDNPTMMSMPVDYINDVDTISKNDNMISVNSCLQVDLFGQVNSESIGLQHIGGTGGQLDYVMGAYKSKGGKSFLCLPSTRTMKDGTRQSLILPVLPEGSIVSVPRSGVHYIVTEYGAVNLKGKNTYERAELLISIAHPDFRDELRAAAEKMGLTRKSSKVVK